MAVAYGWAWRVMIIGLEMVVPGLVGYWIDQRLGTKAVFTVGGFVLGMALGFWHLIKIAGGPPAAPPSEKPSQSP
ncbi:MAG: AtpZ/AtpI family protein [Planctomycetes bacterium]|nr:AtpZ/AtpI family protein [Planctomycetota bacterium]